LLSASVKSTQQSLFVEKIFAERTLLSATFGKAFAECKGLFVECKNTRQSPNFQWWVCWDNLESKQRFHFALDHSHPRSLSFFFRNKFQLLLLRTKRSFSPLIDQWIGSLV
jgi:hypothetical protein